MAIEVDAQDVTDAENVLTDFLNTKIPDGDYTQGSALRDLAVKALAYNFAFMRKTGEQIVARQSLLSVGTVDTTDDPEAADDAVDEILSNWFAKRNAGRFARVTALGHASERIDLTIPGTARFYRTNELIFLLDNNAEDLFIPAQDLQAVIDSSGQVIDYTFNISLVADTPGTQHEIDAGVFTAFDDFSPFVTRVETLVRATGGDDVETTDNFIARAQNLITVRNLINPRSVDATLLTQFDDIRNLFTVGMGDPEMVRDLVREEASGLEIHVGGHMDIFYFANTVETSFSGVVGAMFTRPDGLINVFRDPTYAPGGAGHKFTDPDPVTLKTIQVGMVLRLQYDTVGLPAPLNPHDYIIRDVRATELIVSERVPFALALDEITTGPNETSWSIGLVQPGFSDVVPMQILTGQTSRQVSNVGRITLPGGPIYQIKSVTIEDPADPDSDPVDGLVRFNVRSNTTPTNQVAPNNEFQLLVNTPTKHQSMRSWAEVVVGTATTPTKYAGKTLKVVYDTLVSFTTVHNFIDNRRQRISAANPLLRGYHPAYLSATIEYDLRRTATTIPDEDAVAASVVSFINNYDPQDILDVSQVSTFITDTYPEIGRVYPFTIFYGLHTPDGRVVDFETTEDVIVPSDPNTLNELQVSPSDPINSFNNPLDFGVTDDVIRYLAADGAIVVTRRAS